MITTKKIALVRSILELSIEITNSSVVDVFVDYSGHVNCLTVKVYLDGWSPERLQNDYYKILYLDRDNVNELTKIIDYLKLIKEEI
jgi:hypothetical protein